MAFRQDGTELGILVNFFKAHVQVSFEKLMLDIGLKDIPETLDRFFTLEMGNPAVIIDGVRQSLFVRDEEAEGGPQLHQVTHVRVVGKAHIDVAEVALSHHRLGDVIFSQGTSTIGERQTLLVATEDERGGQVSIRFGEEADDTDPQVSESSSTRSPAQTPEGSDVCRGLTA